MNISTSYGKLLTVQRKDRFFGKIRSKSIEELKIIHAEEIAEDASRRNP